MKRPRHATRITRVFLVEDEPLVRRGLRVLFSLEPDLEVCGEAESEREALDGILTQQPDLTVVDLNLKQGTGLALITQLRQQLPTLRILVFSMHSEVEMVRLAFAAGAAGYVLKEEGTDQVLDAIRQVVQGRRYLSTHLAAKYRVSCRAAV